MPQADRRAQALAQRRRHLGRRRSRSCRRRAPNPIESKGTEKNELLQGGMWLVSRFEGEMVGMPFTGVGTFGYDPIEKKYVGTWVDSMTPHLMIMKGDYDAATKTMTSTGEGRDARPAKLPVQAHLPLHRRRHAHLRNAHAADRTARITKMMEIKYKRRAGSDICTVLAQSACGLTRPQGTSAE